MPRRRSRRSSPPLPLSMWGRTSIGWKRVFFFTAGIVSVLTAITLIPKVIPILDPWVPALHDYVRQMVEPVQQQTDVLLYWKLEDQKNRFKSDEGGWGIQLQKETDPQAKSLIQQQIFNSRREQDKINERIQQLKVPTWAK